MHAERSPGDARMTGYAESEPADTPKRQSPHPPVPSRTIDADLSGCWHFLALPSRHTRACARKCQGCGFRCGFLFTLLLTHFPFHT